MKNKGFTLVELLAVIVILAIILAIAIPAITGLIDSSKRAAFESDAKFLIKAIDYKKLEDPSFDETTITESNIESILNIPADNIKTLSVSNVEGVRKVSIEGQGEWDGLYAYGSYMELQTFTSEEDWTAATSVGGGGAPVTENAPVLATGMTPIKWVNNVEEPIEEDDPTWYDYENKLWANAKTADGSYWVWIPRYAYSITSNYHKGLYAAETIGTIEVKFLNGTTNNALDNSGEVATTPTYEGSVQTNFVLHPAFNFGGTQVTGIWVAKFEASSNSGKVKIVPNVEAWRNINIATMYNNSRSMEADNTYGWGTTGTGIDTHMMKNTEWGAVAYLSKSSYGKETEEIYINPSNFLITGRGGETKSQASTWDNSGSPESTIYGYDGRQCSSKTGQVCTGPSNQIFGMASSTTGNITGIYDISGGVKEYVMGNLNRTTSSSSLTLDLVTVPDKYINVYTSVSNDNGYRSEYFGDAFYETSELKSWYKDYLGKLSTTYAWFSRGGDYANTVDAGAFYVSPKMGEANTTTGFRPVLIVGNNIDS